MLVEVLVIEFWVGVWFGMWDYVFIFGEMNILGLFVVIGYYCNGILLVLIIVKIVVDLIVEGCVIDLGVVFVLKLCDVE